MNSYLTFHNIIHFRGEIYSNRVIIIGNGKVCPFIAEVGGGGGYILLRRREMLMFDIFINKSAAAAA